MSGIATPLFNAMNMHILLSHNTHTHMHSTNKTVQFMDFIYLSQVVQGLCIKAEAEHYRRLLSEDGTFTRGTLYWQLVNTLLAHEYHYNSTKTNSILPPYCTTSAIVHNVSCPLQNDIWQAQSWASIQYDLSWKILHHYMKTVYNSMLVSAYEYEGYIAVYFVNDMAPLTSIDYMLEIQVITWEMVRMNNIII